MLAPYRFSAKIKEPSIMSGFALKGKFFKLWLLSTVYDGAGAGPRDGHESLFIGRYRLRRWLRRGALTDQGG